MKVETFFKQSNHVKLTGSARRKLRDNVFKRDGWQCVDCGTPYNLTLSHKIHKGIGGGKGPGDTLDNCECRCIRCHLEEEMNINGKIKR